MFVREQTVVTPEDGQRTWQQDATAKTIFEYAQERGAGVKIIRCYAVSDSAADTIVDLSATLGLAPDPWRTATRQPVASFAREHHAAGF